MRDLTLKVRQIDGICIDDADGTDAGGGELQDQRRAETAGTDNQDLGV